MYLLSLLIGTALAASANWCGTGSPSSQELAAIMSLQAAEKDGSLLHRRQNKLIDIPVYVTGIVNSTNSDDELSQAVLEEQVDVLVDRFAPYDITFTVQNITRLVDDDLSQGYSSNGWNLYKYKARKGGYGTLNLYYVTNMDDTVWSAGACTLPSDNITDASPFYYKLDGCTLTSYTVPGGIDADGKVYKGEISVHEVGHWLSLVHTFQGNSCDGPGVSNLGAAVGDARISFERRSLTKGAL